MVSLISFPTSRLAATALRFWPPIPSPFSTMLWSRSAAQTPADVYTGFTGEIPNANYTGFGGNGSTTGTFAGAGANDPQPIENAPPFDSTNRVTSSGKRSGVGRATNTTINVSNSDELLALLNDLHPGRDGRIRIPDSKRASQRTTASRFNTAADVNAHRRAMDRRTASIPAMRRLPQ